MAHHDMSQSNLNQDLDPWRETPKQAVKKRKQARKKAAFATKLEAMKPIEPVDLDYARGWVEPEPDVPKEKPKWEDDHGYKSNQKTPAELENERIKEKHKFWPWRQTVPRNLVTLAPYLLNNIRDTTKKGQPFALSGVKQTCLLFEMLLPNDVVRQKITELLFENHDTAWKFAATSRQSWRYVTYDTAMWDFTRGWFGNCQFPRERFLDKDNLIAEPIQGSVASVVIVSPVRGPKKFPCNIEELDEVPEEVDEHLYEHQIRSMRRMCLSMSNFADFFRNLQLHRLPFLTTNILELIIPMMRNLKVLGVYKCQLIHVGDTMKLLEIIQTDKPKGKDTQISLDFYPNYHQGPLPCPGNNNQYYVGAYGVTWDNWNGDTRLAVWQLISIIIPQAQKQKQDFWSKYTMFRQWLDKSPCWRVSETLATLIHDPGDIRTGEEIDEDFVVMCDYPNTGGSKRKFKSNVPNRPESYEWMLERHPCMICGLNVLGIFHYYNDIRWASIEGLTANQLQLHCLGCRLTAVLNTERDHYKPFKRRVIEKWLRLEDDPESGEQVWNNTDMAKALTDFDLNGIANRARGLDFRRIKAMLRPEGGLENALDRENDEVQVPLNREELGRLGKKNRSPTVDSKDPVIDQWNWFDKTRLFAHGHGTPL